ncbi:Protein phosphatase 2A regulatory subunit A, partial [Trachipleistophora hominis]
VYYFKKAFLIISPCPSFFPSPAHLQFFLHFFLALQMLHQSTISAYHDLLLTTTDLSSTVASMLTAPVFQEHSNLSTLINTLLKSPFYVHRLAVCHLLPYASKSVFYVLFNDNIQLVSRTAMEMLPAGMLSHNEILECLDALVQRNDYLQCGAADLLCRLEQHSDKVHHFLRSVSWRVRFSLAKKLDRLDVFYKDIYDVLKDDDVLFIKKAMICALRDDDVLYFLRCEDEEIRCEVVREIWRRAESGSGFMYLREYYGDKRGDGNDENLSRVNDNVRDYDSRDNVSRDNVRNNVRDYDSKDNVRDYDSRDDVKDRITKDDNNVKVTINGNVNENLHVNENINVNTNDDYKISKEDKKDQSNAHDSLLEGTLAPINNDEHVYLAASHAGDEMSTEEYTQLIANTSIHALKHDLPSFLMKDPSPKVKFNLLKLLKTKSLVQQFVTSTDWREREQALEYSLDSDLYFRFLVDPVAHVRCKAARLFRQPLSSATISKLKEIVRSDNYLYRMNVVHVLVSNKHESMRDMLGVLARDRIVNVRDKVLSVIESERAVYYIDVVEQMVDDDDEEVCRRAEQVLHVLRECKGMKN